MTQTITTKARRRSRRVTADNGSILARLMNESVRMPGFPQVVVTREFLYHFLRGCGWCPCERGLGSMEHLTFGRRAVAGPITDEVERDRLLALVRDGYLREAKAA